MNTQKKQEINTKIEELKKTIAELEAKVNEPEEHQPWEPHGAWYIEAGIDRVDAMMEDVEGINCFVSKHAAQYAEEKLKPIYKLLSYVTEFDKPEYGGKGYCITYTWEGVWKTYQKNTLCRYLDVICMSKRCAEELVDKLNKGLVKLD